MFASTALTRDLLSVLGQIDFSRPLRPTEALAAIPGVAQLYRAACVDLSPMTLQLLLIARDAFMAVRARGMDVIATYGAAMVCWNLGVHVRQGRERALLAVVLPWDALCWRVCHCESGVDNVRMTVSPGGRRWVCPLSTRPTTSAAFGSGCCCI